MLSRSTIATRRLNNIARTLANTTTTTRNLATMSTKEVTREPTKVVYAQETPEGVGATVRRSIGTYALRNLSPFLMLDHAKIQKGSGFPDHPHRGQSTVTYCLKGKMGHEDFTGAAGTLEPGDVQWMTAGRGIVHSEMPVFDGDYDEVEGMQLWVDLPADKKMIEPSYQEKKAADIDTARPSDGVTIKVISGESHGVKGFVRPVGGCWFLDVRLEKPGATVFQEIPEGWTGFAYIITGEAEFGDKKQVVKKYNTVVFSDEPDQTGIQITRPEGTTEETRLLVIAGQPLNQPCVQHGPFVVTNQREVLQAMIDYQTGRNGFENAPNWKSKLGAPLRGD